MSKAEAGEVKWSKSKLKKSNSTSEIQKIPRLVPGQSFKDMATLVPALSENDKNGPLIRLFEEKSNMVPHESKNVNKNPWNEDYKIGRTGPYKFRILHLWSLCLTTIL